LDWTQAPDDPPTQVIISGQCNRLENSTPVVTYINFSELQNIGSITIPVSQLVGNNPLQAGDSCNAEVSLSRTQDGTVDSNLQNSSSIVATQLRRVGKLTITP
jgi:hypothetical protein